MQFSLGKRNIPEPCTHSKRLKLQASKAASVKRRHSEIPCHKPVKISKTKETIEMEVTTQATENKDLNFSSNFPVPLKLPKDSHTANNKPNEEFMANVFWKDESLNFDEVFAENLEKCANKNQKSFWNVENRG